MLTALYLYPRQNSGRATHFDPEAFLQNVIVQTEDAVIEAVLGEASQRRQEIILKIIIIIKSPAMSQERSCRADFCGVFSPGFKQLSDGFGKQSSVFAR